MVIDSDKRADRDRYHSVYGKEDKPIPVVKIERVCIPYWGPDEALPFGIGVQKVSKIRHEVTK